MLLPRASAAVVVAALIGAAAPASAQVAVSLAVTDGDASQRHIASAVVEAVRERWRTVSPQMPASATSHCKAGDTACLREAAAKHGATHLVVVAVAPLGIRDRVVAVQLFDVTQAAPLFEESAVQQGFSEDLDQVRALTTRLVQHAAPPAATPVAPYVPPAVDGDAPLSALGWTGIGVASVGALAAGGAGIAGTVLGAQREPAAARNVFFYGILAGGLLATAGASIVVVDSL